MDKAVQGSNNHGFEVKSPKTANKRLQGMNGGATAVLLGGMTGIKIGLQRPSKILNGWTLRKWTSQTRSTRKKISRNGRSA